MVMKGKDRHLKRLKTLQEEAIERATKVVYAGADKIAAHAKKSITKGSVSGKNHKPSSPGSPPSNDTGVLKNSIKVEKKTLLEAKVIADAPYAAVHEFGGTINHPGGTPYFMRDGKAVFVSKSGAGAFHGLPVTKPHTIEMPARPFMRPSRDALKKEIRDFFVKEMSKLVKGSGK